MFVVANKLWVNISNKPNLIPNLRVWEYGKNIKPKASEIINNRENKILIIKMFPKYLGAFEKSLDSSLVAIALIPKSTIIKKMAGQFCIKLKAPYPFNP